MKYINSHIKTYFHTKPFIKKPSRVFAASNKTSMEVRGQVPCLLKKPCAQVHLYRTNITLIVNI